MTDTVTLEALPAEGAVSPLMPHRSAEIWGGRLRRLLDGLPWWALVVIAGLTFLVLHELASADRGQAYNTATTSPTASQLILIVLANAGQYLFPALLLAEAVAVGIALRCHPLVRREGWQAAAPGAALHQRADTAERPCKVWSATWLSRFDSQRFAALAMAYYRERGMRCDLLASGPDSAIVLRLFQEGPGKAPVVVQCRPKGAAWVGARQVAALRAVMDRERIAKGLFMTPGVFSKDAREAALANRVTLIDGRLFLMMIGRLAPAARARLLEVAMA